MKFKTTAIAMAVAGVVAAPVAVQAGADEMYASARVGVSYEDTGGTSDTDVKSFSSRFGAKGETDLGNGLIGYGKYEWDVDMGSGDSAQITTRHRMVGLKGEWGNAYIGQTYHTYYNFVVGPTDTPYWNTNWAQIDYTGRTDDGITYAGGSGSFAFGATAYMTRDGEEDAVDVYEGGVSYTFGNDMVLAGAVKGTAADLDDGTGTLIGNGNDEAVVGVALGGIALGNFSLAFSGMSQDDDTSFVAEVATGGFIFHLEAMQMDEDSPANTSGDDIDPLQVMVGYSHALGRKTTMWYEISSFDADSDDSDDDNTQILAVLRYDII